jgi:hypothetical protein
MTDRPRLYLVGLDFFKGAIRTVAPRVLKPPTRHQAHSVGQPHYSINAQILEANCIVLIPCGCSDSSETSGDQQTH